MAKSLEILLIIFLGILITTITSVILRKLLPKFTRNTKTEFDDFLLKALSDFSIPAGVLFTIYLVKQNLSLSSGADKIIVIVLQFFILIYTVRFSNRVLARFLEGVVRRAGDVDLQQLVASIIPLIRSAVWVIGSLVYLQSLGMQMAAVWALLSAGGIGAGLALKEPAMELFAYLMILLDKPFRVGQFINVGDTWASVEKIGVRSTHLRNLRGEIVVMNNSILTSSVISNFADMSQRRIVQKIGVIYDTCIENIKFVPEVIEEIINLVDHSKFDRCHFVEFGDFSLNFEIVYYIDSNNYNIAMDTQQSINFRIVEEFAKRGIVFAFPTQTIYIENSSEPMKLK